MRILILHNRYRDTGGEERAVADLVALLVGYGHEVQVLERSSADVSGLTAARGLLAGGVDTAEVARTVREFGAEVVHAHNLHPLFGWRALAASKRAGARTVLHLHNFRLFCAIGVAYRDGGPCFRCRGRNTSPSLRFKCRGSRGEALAYAVGISSQQRRLFRNTDRFIAVSSSLRYRLVELGLPDRLTETLCNFIPARNLASTSSAHLGEFALVSGRLVQAKGFDTAITAASITNVPLVVAGGGPERSGLEALARGSDVRFTGPISEAELARLRARAAVVLVPSRSDDAFPYAALDALAAGVPVLASDHGGLPELVGVRSLVPGDDPRLWADALAGLWTNPEARLIRGTDALNRARSRFSERAYYTRLLRCYQADTEV